MNSGRAHKLWPVISAFLAKSVSWRLSWWWWGMQFPEDCSPITCRSVLLKLNSHGLLHVGLRVASYTPNTHPQPHIGTLHSSYSWHPPPSLPLWIQNPRTDFIVVVKSLWWVLDPKKSQLSYAEVTKTVKQEDQPNNGQQKETALPDNCRRVEATGVRSTEWATETHCHQLY